MLIKLADNSSLGRMTNTLMTISGIQRLSTGWSDALRTGRHGLLRMNVHTVFAFRKLLALLQERRDSSMAVV